MAISEGEENRYCSRKMLGTDVPQLEKGGSPPGLVQPYGFSQIDASRYFSFAHVSNSRVCLPPFKLGKRHMGCSEQMYLAERPMPRKVLVSER
jgi:hypothetical protein